jgi:hypothetical protein
MNEQAFTECLLPSGTVFGAGDSTASQAIKVPVLLERTVGEGTE